MSLPSISPSPQGLFGLNPARPEVSRSGCGKFTHAATAPLRCVYHLFKSIFHILGEIMRFVFCCRVKDPQLGELLTPSEMAKQCIRDIKLAKAKCGTIDQATTDVDLHKLKAAEFLALYKLMIQAEKGLSKEEFLDSMQVALETLSQVTRSTIEETWNEFDKGDRSEMSFASCKEDGTLENVELLRGLFRTVRDLACSFEENLGEVFRESSDHTAVNFFPFAQKLIDSVTGNSGSIQKLSSLIREKQEEKEGELHALEAVRDYIGSFESNSESDLRNELSSRLESIGLPTVMDDLQMDLIDALIQNPNDRAGADALLDGEIVQVTERYNSDIKSLIDDLNGERLQLTRILRGIAQTMPRLQESYKSGCDANLSEIMSGKTLTADEIAKLNATTASLKQINDLYAQFEFNGGSSGLLAASFEPQIRAAEDEHQKRVEAGHYLRYLGTQRLSTLEDCRKIQRLMAGELAEHVVAGLVDYSEFSMHRSDDLRALLGKIIRAAEAEQDDSVIREKCQAVIREKCQAVHAELFAKTSSDERALLLSSYRSNLSNLGANEFDLEAFFSDNPQWDEFRGGCDLTILRKMRHLTENLFSLDLVRDRVYMLPESWIVAD